MSQKKRRSRVLGNHPRRKAGRGTFREPVKQKPHCLFLFDLDDEIEKGSTLRQEKLVGHRCRDVDNVPWIQGRLKSIYYGFASDLSRITGLAILHRAAS